MKQAEEMLFHGWIVFSIAAVGQPLGGRVVLSARSVPGHATGHQLPLIQQSSTFFVDSASGAASSRHHLHPTISDDGS